MVRLRSVDTFIIEDVDEFKYELGELKSGPRYYLVGNIKRWDTLTRVYQAWLITHSGAPSVQSCMWSMFSWRQGFREVRLYSRRTC